MEKPSICGLVQLLRNPRAQQNPFSLIYERAVAAIPSPLEESGSAWSGRDPAAGLRAKGCPGSSCPPCRRFPASTLPGVLKFSLYPFLPNPMEMTLKSIPADQMASLERGFPDDLEVNRR